MNVLMSIKPKYANKIFDGTKLYEYRRKIWSRTDVNKIFVYASSPIRLVIGQVEIDTIEQTCPRDIWSNTHWFGGIIEKDFYEYFKNCERGYAIRIKNPVALNTPVAPKKMLGVSAPQSWCYVDRS